ncbi:hypothetical protein D3C79_754810 [compost metagenome]
MLQRTATERIALSQRTVDIDQPLGYQKQADALDPRWRVGQTCEHQVDDVVAQVLLATADEYFAAAQLIAAISVRLSASAQQRQVSAGLRFGQAHGAGPLAADQLRQVALLELGTAMAIQCQHRAFGEP